MNPLISKNPFTIPILTAPQLRAADALTVQSQGITSLELMERAAQAAADEIEPRLWYPGNVTQVVVCCANHAT